MAIVRLIEADILKTWLDNDEAIVIDVREPVEYEAEHIKGSHPIPLGELSESHLSIAHGKKIVLHCMLGKRGGAACTKLLDNNPKLDIYNLRGGICAWKEAGFPVEK
ncbi:MAG: hypothetical protein A3E85_03325 [Gammaproteobacteria bacterium RIFCSPHIGHO2_12_FULL_45_12]|nr:MAG: hypothetical protein A3E85_03325 [Gammaproteobacteria bacterium RIFCSPHIGHO2_12_FULL_45_12]